MNELIKIEERNGKRAVSARELHCFLGSKQDFSTWIKNRIEKYQFTGNVDYQAFHKIVECQNGIGNSTRIEYALSVDMAKELCMIENNEQGRLARKYFIACEKELIEKVKTPQNYLEALKVLVTSEEAKQRLQEQNQKLISDNIYKSDIIEGLTSGIPLADMRQRINQMIRRGDSSDMHHRWATLYNEFNLKYHVNVWTRISNAQFKGSVLDYIDKKLDMVPELYELACKLFEGSYNQLMESWGKFARRAEVVRQRRR